MSDAPTPRPEGQITPTVSGADDRAVRPASTARLKLVGVLAAAVAGLAAWGVGESPVGKVEPAQSKLMVMGQETETMAATPEAIRAAERQTAIRGTAIAGGLLGLALGLASGLASGRKAGAMLGGGVGLVLGAVAGAAGPFAAIPLHEAMRTPGKDDLLPAILMHATLWVAVGLVGGLAFGLGRGTRPGPIVASAIAGAVGGAIGAVVFQVVGSIAFPTAGAEKLIPGDPIARLVSRLFVSIGIGLLVVMAQEPRPKAETQKGEAPA
jgi:hypothetical protein